MVEHESPQQPLGEANRRLRARIRALENELARLAGSSDEAAAALSAARLERRRLKRELAALENRQLVRLALRADGVIKRAIGRQPVQPRAVEDGDRPPKPAKMKTKKLKVGRGAARSLGAETVLPEPVQPVEAPQVTPRVDLLRFREPVSVVIPIHGALEALRACIDSLVRNTTSEASLVLIDDGSADERLDSYLTDLEERLPNTRVIRHAENRGFAATANEGFDLTSHDVVLLNSDTEVPPRWLESLRRVAYSDPTIGTVTPLSNNAGAFSAPEPGAGNDLPAGIDAIGRAVAQESGRVVPETPTAHGFCMYVKRCVLDAVGGFDAESFPRGYGEENDFCMRASDAGWRHVIDDSTFVLPWAPPPSRKTGASSEPRRVPSWMSSIPTTVSRREISATPRASRPPGRRSGGQLPGAPQATCLGPGCSTSSTTAAAAPPMPHPIS